MSKIKASDIESIVIDIDRSRGGVAVVRLMNHKGLCIERFTAFKDEVLNKASAVNAKWVKYLEIQAARRVS